MTNLFLKQKFAIKIPTGLLQFPAIKLLEFSMQICNILQKALEKAENLVT